MNSISAKALSNNLRKHLRAAGYFQKDLADELGLHPKVLSRKLSGNGNAHLTEVEVRRIITTLARWQAITTQNEAIQLLELAQKEQSSCRERRGGRATPPGVGTGRGAADHAGGARW